MGSPFSVDLVPAGSIDRQRLKLKHKQIN